MRLLYEPPAEDSPSLPLIRLYGKLDFPPPYPERPYIFVNMAMTLDGKVVSGLPGFLLTGSPADRLGMDELRAAADCLLIGAGTLRTENPVLHIRHPALRQQRVSEGMPENPFYAVVSGSGRLPAESRAFSTPAKPLIFTTRQMTEANRKDLAGRAEIVITGEKAVDLPDMARLLRERGVRYLLLEGGPNLTFSMLEAGLIDEFFITLAPLLKGGKDTPTLLEGEGFAPGKVKRLTLCSIREHEGEVFLRYRVNRPA